MSDPSVGGLPVLRGERVVLRPAVGGDVEVLAQIRRHPEVHRYWMGGEDLEAAVRQDMAEEDSHGYVIEVEDAVVGWIQWQAEEDPDYRQASMDIYLDPEVRGGGLGTEAVRVMCAHLIDDHGHHRLTIDPAAENAAAIASYAKVGFEPVGICRQGERGPDGVWRDQMLMDMLADELVRRR